MGFQWSNATWAEKTVFNTILCATLRIQKPNHQAEYPNKVYTTFRMRNFQTILSWTQNKMYKNNIICKLYTRKCEENNSKKYIENTC